MIVQVMWGTRLRGGLNDGILAAAVDPMTGDVFATGYTAGDASVCLLPFPGSFERRGPVAIQDDLCRHDGSLPAVGWWLANLDLVHALRQQAGSESVRRGPFRFWRGRSLLVLIRIPTTTVEISFSLFYPRFRNEAAAAFVHQRRTNLCHFFPLAWFNPHAATGLSDYMVVRLRGMDGSERWRSTRGGGWMKHAYADAHVRDSACALAVDGRGSIVIAGNTEGALFSSTGVRGVLLIRSLRCPRLEPPRL